MAFIEAGFVQARVFLTVSSRDVFLSFFLPRKPHNPYIPTRQSAIGACFRGVKQKNAR